MATSVLIVLTLIMMMMMKSDAASAETVIVTTTSGESVLLTSDLLTVLQGDVRWTHRHLLLKQNRTTTCHHGRCELLADGSLRFSRVQNEDSGNYTLEVFDKGGRLLMRTDFLLRVEGSSGHVGGSAFIYCFLLMFLLLFIIITIFILRRRRSQRSTITGQKEEHVYVVMQSHHGNKRKDEREENQEKEEEPLYVPCDAVVSMRHEEDVYV